MARDGIDLRCNARDWIYYMNKIPENIQSDIERKIPSLRSATRRKVREKLTFGNGVKEGIYRNSFIINNYQKSKWQVGFQVFAKKPHYRLTHLLENRHWIKVFKWGMGQKTKWGNLGMVAIHRKTKKVKHIEPAQKYAEKEVLKLYKQAIKDNWEKKG